MTSCEPFLNVTSTDHSCSICGIVIPSSSLLKKGIKYRKDLRTIKEQADEWKNLNVPENDIYNWGLPFGIEKVHITYTCVKV